MKLLPRRTPAMMIASGAVALTLVAAGGAVAGSLVTSADIKDNTIRSADVKNGTLRLKDITDSARAALAGPLPPSSSGYWSGYAPLTAAFTTVATADITLTERSRVVVSSTVSGGRKVLGPEPTMFGCRNLTHNTYSESFYQAIPSQPADPIEAPLATLSITSSHVLNPGTYTIGVACSKSEGSSTLLWALVTAFAVAE